MLLEGVTVGLIMSLAVMGPAADYNPAAGFCDTYYQTSEEFKSDLEELNSRIQEARTSLYQWSSYIKESGQISLENAVAAANYQASLKWGERLLYKGYRFVEYCDAFLSEDEK